MQILEPSPKVATGFAPQLPDFASAGFQLNAEDPRWQLALRIAASGTLGRSQLLSDFLLYIVDRSIHGRTDQITEQQIGVIVFGRTEDYDSNEDNIVRSYARKLRKRIEEYFATEGSKETLRLEIPRGGYAPIFSEHIPEHTPEHAPVLPTPVLPTPEQPIVIAEKAIAPQELSTSAIVPPHVAELSSTTALNPWTRITGKLSPGLLAALLLGAFLGSVGTLLRHSRLVVPRAEALSHTLWKQIFSSSSDTFIVPSDDGLIVMQHHIARPVPLTAYVNGTYKTAIQTDSTPGVTELARLGNRRFTSVVDLDFAAHLAQLKEVVPARMMIRYARDLRMDDLRTGNAILIGSDESDPWIELFRPQLHFSFRFEPDPDKPSGFANLYPRTGEATLYTTKGQEEQTYGIIAYVPNLTNSGHVLIIAGLNTAGTQAAATFLLDPALMMPTLQKARTANGDLQPFELLVGAGNVATNASTPHIILERIGLPPGQSQGH